MVTRMRGVGDSNPTQEPEKTYQDYVFLQNADGSWKEELVGLVGEASFENFKGRQTSADVKAVAKASLLTLAGVKILTTKFPDNHKEWKLVVNKAYGFLKKHNPAKSKAQLEALVGATVTL